MNVKNANMEPFLTLQNDCQNHTHSEKSNTSQGELVSVTIPILKSLHGTWWESTSKELVLGSLLMGIQWEKISQVCQCTPTINTAFNLKNPTNQPTNKP